MVTVKKKTIQTKKFEKQIIGAIKTVNAMPEVDKETILDILRTIHNTCLEWQEPEEEFRILPELEVVNG